MMKKLIWLGLAFFALFALIQLVPYGKQRINPPVVSEPQWDSPETRELVKLACFDCHSHEVAYPWYSAIAPVSWLLQKDIDEGREAMNFSDWDQFGLAYRVIEREIAGGKMPPGKYLLMHPAARYSTTQTQKMLDGLKKTLE